MKDLKQTLEEDLIIQEFEYAYKNRRFHDLTSTNEYKEVFFGADVYTRDSLKKAVEILKSKGYNVEYRMSSCARGWFDAIRILNWKEG